MKGSKGGVDVVSGLVGMTAFLEVKPDVAACLMGGYSALMEFRLAEAETNDPIACRVLVKADPHGKFASDG